MMDKTDFLEKVKFNGRHEGYKVDSLRVYGEEFLSEDY